MKRLNSLALLAAGIAAGLGGSLLYSGYWPEPKPATAAEQHDHGEAPPEAAGHDHADHDAADGEHSGHDHTGHGSDHDQAENGENGREVLYYRDPMGSPDTSPVPKKDSMGMDYIPVYADEGDEKPDDAGHDHQGEDGQAGMDHDAEGHKADEHSGMDHDSMDHGSMSGESMDSDAMDHDSMGGDAMDHEDYNHGEASDEKGKGEASSDADGEREILYYRNPMGLPDTSPVPKKDSMGMDYIPVYADEAEGGDTVKVSLDKIQRSGVKTEKVGRKALSREVRGVGTVEHDESTISVVTVRSDGYIEDLFVDRMGQHVEAGEPMFRFYSSQIQLAQVDLLVSLRSRSRTGSDREVEGAIQKLRNLDVPQSRIEEVIETKKNPRTLDWPAPATGHVMSKDVLKGQFVEAGEELFRIANTDHVWVIAEVAEADIGEVAVGAPATVTLRAFPNKPHEGKVTFVYPHMTNMQTRTVPVRIELPNPDGDMRPGMYADVVFHRGAEAPDVVAVPDDAVIDSGARTVVLIAKGGGRFQPREVKLGRRGQNYVEILEGVSEGEEVVTSATFLIDSESKLKAALQTFDQDKPVEGMAGEGMADEEMTEEGMTQ
ncbi:efflux RND transporter periplasmic adaptor subunit [Methyloligella solikamskensis]|uniref:Efflux RND transporter periplasmic adaptor subunit n=1 Tax=Methyloligella solikamskensis TaxID=1177756 RepID=A0ABW3JD46_9HYPH